MRPILHAHRDGKYVAIDNPGAVVIDYDARMIRAGLERQYVRGPALFRFIAFMLRSANLTQDRAAISAALGYQTLSPGRICHLVCDSEPILGALGMLIETVYGAGYCLHTEPRETLACCRTLAPGQPLPSRLRNILAAPGDRLTTCARSRRRLTTSSAR